LPDTAVPRIRLDAGDPTAGYPTGCPPARLRPASAAYIIYTSGSSGRPKGVVATHGGLRNLADLQAELIGVRPEDRVLAVHSIGFDVSVSELVTTLGAGAELRLVPRDDRQPGPDLARAIADHGITVADLPPVVLSAMDPGALAGLRSLTVGGEACAPDVAAAWARGREFVNAYGLTETTVTAIAGRYTGDDSSVPIGRPLTGALAYVLDSRLEPVPVGVTGELYVGGAVVARGYLRDPARTAERFVPDPFAQLPGRRMYRTGDLVRYRGDGQLEFVGRADSQVKVRGHRIELGEVEARLRACPGVQRCAVVLREDRPGDRRLVAYVVGDAGGAERLRHRLGRELPAYMVPAAFVPVPDLPVTPSGKLDVQALPAPGPDRPLLDTDWVPPQDTTEETVAGVWRGVLGVSQVGAHDNFFDLGGNSLLLAKMRARLHTTTGVDIPTVELFRHPTVAMLARFLVGGHAPVPARSDGRDQHTEDRRRAFAERARRIRDQPSKTGWA
jgi:amino acid adenylation domain-containing protein